MARSLRLPVRDSYNLVLADLTWFIDPATGEELGSVADFGLADTKKAIEAASKAFKTWGKTTAKV